MPPAAAATGLAAGFSGRLGLALALGRRLRLRQAGLQRVHQVDDIAALGRCRDDRLVALQLLPDHVHQRDLVAILVVLRIELGFLLLDQLFGELQHFRVRVADRDVAEIFGGAAHLVGVAQRADEHAVLARADGHHAFAAGHHQPGDRQLAGLAHRFAQHDECFLGHRSVGRQVIGRILVDHVDRVFIDEGLDVHRVVGFDPDRIEVGVLDDDVLLVLVFVALDQVRALDQAELRIDRLHVDAVVGLLVQLIEGDALARAGCRIEPHRAAHQTQLEVALPTCSGRHACLLRGDTIYVRIFTSWISRIPANP